MDGSGARNGSRECGAKKSLRAGLLLATLALGMPLSAYGEGVTLEFRGLEEGRVLTNVRNTVPAPDIACDAPRARFQSYLRDAERRALSALRALGHFNAVVDTRVDVSMPCPRLVLVIEAGPEVRLDQVDIRIVGPFEEDPSAQRFREGLRLRAGAVLDQGVYDSTRDELVNRARARGYLDARYVERELWVDPDQNIARVTLVLESGGRYHFGEIRADQRILEPRFFNRLMPVREGDPYSSDRLALISSNLAASGYFADVRVRPDIDARGDHDVPVNVLLTERARTAYEFRVGFGTDTGARVRADVDRRRVNRRGHKWRAGVGLSQRIQSIDTIYSIPQRNPLTDSLDIYARLQREDNNSILAQSGTTGVQYSRQRGDWSQAVFSEYVYERTQFGDEPQRSSNFLLAGVRLGHRQLDDPLFPTRGHSFNLKLQGAAESLMSSASLVQTKVNGAFAYPLGRAILKARGEVGTTWTSDFTELPKSLRFFAGGDNSVRGYAYESLGPRNADDKVVGGRHLVVMSVEAMYPVVGNDWYGAAFVDVGNAFDNFREMELKTGAGVGVRWRSPIGMVRIDVAVPFNGTNRSPRLHLGIGAEF
jgi:translocation and assembly module TamA